MPPQPYTPRASSLTTRQLMDIRYTPPTSSLRRSPVPPIGSTSPSRVIPITVTRRVQHQSPASRRDMISFTKAQAAMSSTATTTTTKDKPTGQRENQTNVPKMEIEKAEPIKQVPQEETQVSPIKSSTTETKSVTVVSPPMMSLRERNETRSEKQVSDEKEKDKVYERDHKDNEKREPISPHEKKILDTVSLEEIIENVIKPAGIEAKVGSSGESKVKYHVEKTEQEDGKTKMQIVLESKVEEELDISEDSGLEELQNQRVKNVSLEDIKDTATGSMIKSLLSCLQESEDLGNKTINVEIIEEPGDSHSDEELEIERKSKSSFNEPTSTYFQIEELENVTHEPQRSDDDDAMKTSMTGTDNIRVGSVQVQDVSKESEISYFSHDQEPHDYFVSTPDDNFSEHEEGGGITSYGHYGMLDDLSDERYYQDDVILPQKVFVEESDEYNLPGGHSFVKESFSECIIEEEVCVSPVVQESVLELLKEDSLEPKEQLKGALEKLQSSVSGPLREELAFLTKVSSEGPQNVAVDVKKVQQSNDNGTMTIVAEMNVSQTLEDSGVLEAGDDLSEEQIMAALKSSDLGLDKAFQGGARGGYSFKISKEENVMYGEEFEDLADEGESALEITEKHLQLGPSEKSFTYQMDIQGSHAKASLEPEIQSQTLSTPVKRIATLILESPPND